MKIAHSQNWQRKISEYQFDYLVSVQLQLVWFLHCDASCVKCELFLCTWPAIYFFGFQIIWQGSKQSRYVRSLSWCLDGAKVCLERHASMYLPLFLCLLCPVSNQPELWFPVEKPQPLRIIFWPSPSSLAQSHVCLLAPSFLENIAGELLIFLLFTFGCHANNQVSLTHPVVGVSFCLLPPSNSSLFPVTFHCSSKLFFFFFCFLTTLLHLGSFSPD